MFVLLVFCHFLLVNLVLHRPVRYELITDLCARNMSRGVTGFFGIPEEDETLQQRRQNEWKERSRRMHSGSMFLRGHKRVPDQPEPVSAAAVSVVSCSPLVCFCCAKNVFLCYLLTCMCLCLCIHLSA